MRYRDVLTKLFTISRATYPNAPPTKLGLEKSLALQKALKFPDRAFSSVHVTGTNGKGSVCTKIAHGLHLHGHRVGLFTSPHISTFRERIRVNNDIISPEAVVDVFGEVLECSEQNSINASFFELVTMAAFEHFRREKVDFAVVEVGLGGRLDATNVITPKLSVITSIGLEHTRILGDTLEAIATQKAGIIKPSAPVIVGPTVPYRITEQVAMKQGSEHRRVLGSFSSFDEENSQIAEEALRLILGTSVNDHHLQEALTRLPPCRIEHLFSSFQPEASTTGTGVPSDDVGIGTSSPSSSNYPRSGNSNCIASNRSAPSPKFAIASAPFSSSRDDASPSNSLLVQTVPFSTTLRSSKGAHVVLDVAHNAPAFTQLFKVLRQKFPTSTFRLVAGFSTGKNLSECLDTVFSFAKHVHFVHTERTHRAAALDDIWAAVSPKHAEQVDKTHNGDVVRTVHHALRCVLSPQQNIAPASEPKEVLVITGSFFIMKDVRDALGLVDEADPDDLNEQSVLKMSR